MAWNPVGSLLVWLEIFAGYVSYAHAQINLLIHTGGWFLSSCARTRVYLSPHFMN